MSGGLNSSSKPAQASPARLAAALTDARGGMAVMAAVVLLPLCIVSFAAVEFHHVTTVRSLMQSAIDAATLAAAKSGAKDAEGLKSQGLPVLRANLAGMGATQGLRVEDVTFTRTGGSVRGEARLCIRSIVANLIGIQETCPSVSSEVVGEASTLEVVLVLDNSGSMSALLPSGETRVAAMRTAATNFITKLESMDDASRNDDIRIGIVPFAGSVRLDPANRSQWWIDSGGVTSADRTLFYSRDQVIGGATGPLPSISKPKRFRYLDAIGVSWAGCVESRPGSFGTTDAAPDPNTPDSLFAPYFAPDEPDVVSGVQGTVYPNDYLDDSITGVLPYKGQERRLNDNELIQIHTNRWKELQYMVEKYVSTNPLKVTSSEIASGAKGPNRWCQTKAVTPLSRDFAAVKASLVSMPLARHTNIALGLMWGWHVLSPNAPFATGAPYGGKGTRKVIVLMTDGDNFMDPPGGSQRENSANRNESYYGPYGYLWRGLLGVPPGLTPLESEAKVTTALNERMRTLCSNMKQKDVVIFAVQFAQGTTADPNLLDCAGSNFKNANQAAELDAAFQSVADEISLLRVAK